MKLVYALLALLGLLLATPALAQAPLPGDSKAKPLIVLEQAQKEQVLMGHVTDPALRLSPFERAELEKKLSDLQVELHADLPVYLVDDLKGETVDAVSERLFRAWKIGSGWESGALLVVTKENEPFLYMGPGIPHPVTDAQAQAILSEFQAAYGLAGLKGAVDHTLELIAMKIREVDGTVPRPPGTPNDKYQTQFYAGVAAMLMVLLFASYWRLRRRNRARAEAVPEPTEEATSLLVSALQRLTGWSVKAPAWFDVLLLTAVALVLRSAWLSVPGGLHIFDEAYYVQDARVILGLPVKAHDLPAQTLSYLDPNREHPPLAKLLIALAMHVLGDNAWGQRSASLFFGTLSIPMLYLIVRRFGGKHAIALMAAYLLAFENLSFIHSRIATLDVFYVFFMLCAFYAYVEGLVEAAAVALALSTNCKITGIFGFATLLGFEVARGGLDFLATRKLSTSWMKNFGVLTVWYIGATLIVLGALDSTWTRFATPIAHIKHILAFGANLTHAIPQGVESEPWQWLINENQVPYAQTREQLDDLVRITSNFRGAMNPYLIFFAPVALVYALARALKHREPLALLAVAMFAGTYAPYLYLWYGPHRICYIYYFLPTVPSLAIATSLVMGEIQPRIVRSAYVGAIAFGMWAYFPFNDFPPHEPVPDAVEVRPQQQVYDRKGDLASGGVEPEATGAAPAPTP